MPARSGDGREGEKESKFVRKFQHQLRTVKIIVSSGRLRSRLPKRLCMCRHCGCFLLGFTVTFTQTNTVPPPCLFQSKMATVMTTTPFTAFEKLFITACNPLLLVVKRSLGNIVYFVDGNSLASLIICFTKCKNVRISPLSLGGFRRLCYLSIYCKLADN